MSNIECHGGCLDDDLAAAFDGEFGDQEPEMCEGSVATGPDGNGEGGSSTCSSDVDLDELGNQGFTEVEALRADAGYEAPPPKRQRTFDFSDVEESRTGVAAASITTTSFSVPSAGECAHPVWVFGLCGLCGRSKEAVAEAEAQEAHADMYGQYLGGSGTRGHGGDRNSAAGAMGSNTGAQAGVVRLKHLHASKEVEVSINEAERIRRGTVTRLLSRRRLILILDLDHTLLNSVHTNEVVGDTQLLVDMVLQDEQAHMGSRRLMHRLADNKLWTKLRPGVFEFLEGLRDAYELHIYTMGDKTYAAEVRRLLDPTGRLFSSVIAKDHSTTTTAKDLDVLLSADELALVLDDTEVVWPSHKRNLLQIQRYHYFPSDLRKWRAEGTALLEQGIDEDVTNGALGINMRVLRAVHTRFFSQDDSSLPPLEQRDVRDILAEHRRRILQGVCITFSRCWPQDRNPRHEPLWQLAEALGATCLTAFDPRLTTHVVAAAGGTEKVHQAQNHGKILVLPSWIQNCSYRWSKLPEQDFAVLQPSTFWHLKSPGHGGTADSGVVAASSDSGRGNGNSSLSPEEELLLAMSVAGGRGGRDGTSGG